MARGARHAATVRAAIAALQADAPAHHMPALTQLVFHVPHKLDNPRLWDLMRRQLPKVVYANPQVDVQVAPTQPNEATSVRVHFANMPERTIVLGDKPASEILRELRTMGRFAHEQR
ncbi:hypothetical protein MBRA1_003849 [Malassezia brasiliensis]|uniref:Ribosomal protein/NADH dehydrogenase domain-containing protein n=1 Tax=Malassezia brasiliensis TaxID=1821822 RepID=A0AAF0DW64_9BASI|nr:hypothetical protein MBRA1_003849 [Malassezia brasiliensis]